MEPHSLSDPPFLYHSTMLNSIMDHCTSTEEVIKNKKALLRQASADNIAHENLVTRKVATEARGPKWQCACKDKSSGRGRWGRKKNHICECPAEPQPSPRASELLLLDFDWSSLDDLQEAFQKEKRKMKSDLAQTMSGFKFKQKKRSPLPAQVDEEMSFEDALAFFELHPEEALPPVPAGPLARYDYCECHIDPDKNRSGRTDCSCPPAPEEVGGTGEQERRPPFFGLKFHVGGKGSSTPGLSGICCFDLTECSCSSYLKSDSDLSRY